MQDTLYNFGYYLIYALPLLAIIFLIARIIKNYDFLSNNKKNKKQ